MRRAASALLAGALALGLAGCQFVTPQWTTHSYSPSDGVDTTVGAVDVRNALLITTDGTTANLIVSFFNQSTSEQSVSLQYTDANGTADRDVSVPAGALVSVRPGGQETVTLDNITAPAGSLFAMKVSVGGSSTSVGVPVLTTNLPGYQTLAPTPTPTDTPTGDDTSTPEPTESPEG